MSIEKELGLPEGFTLQEDIHTVTLSHEGDEVARFTAHVTAEVIKEEADAHLRDKHEKKD